MLDWHSCQIYYPLEIKSSSSFYYYHKLLSKSDLGKERLVAVSDCRLAPVVCFI